MGDRTRVHERDEHLTAAAAMTEVAAAVYARHLAGDPTWSLNDPAMAWAFGTLLERAALHTRIAHQLDSAP